MALDGSLLGLPRAYRDPYTDGAPEDFFKRIPKEEVYKRTGIQVMPFNSLFQLFRAGARLVYTAGSGGKDIIHTGPFGLYVDGAYGM